MGIGFSIVMVCAPAFAVDVDNDGVDDSIDLCCNTPPGVAVDELGRPLADIDWDCDVDIDDISILQNGMTGPLTLGCWFHGDCDDFDPCTLNQCNTTSGLCFFPVIPGCNDCPVVGTCDAELTCDVEFAGSISVPTESDELCFCLAQGEIVHVSVVEKPGGGSSFNPQWRLIDAERNSAVSCGTFTTSQDRNCGPLPSAGNPYQVEIEDNARNDSGDYGAHFQRLSAGRACDQVAISCDIPIGGVIIEPLDTDLFAFDVTDNETVSISVVEQPGSGSSFNPRWRLMDAQGNAPSTCGAWSGGLTALCGSLHAVGSPYRIEVMDDARNDVGSYRVHLQRVAATTACDSVALGCDDPIAGVTEENIDTDLLSFRVSDSEIVRISLLEVAGSGPQYNPQWRLLDGYGRPAAVCGSYGSAFRDCGRLMALGNPYRVEVQDGTRNDTGAYTLHMQRLTLPWSCDTVALHCGMFEDGVIDPVIDTDLFSFAAPEGEFVRVGVFEREPSGVAFNPWWRLLDAAGNPAPVCGNFTTSTSRDCGPLPASRGPYQVEIQDGSRNDIGSYQIFIDFLTSGCPG